MSYIRMSDLAPPRRRRVRSDLSGIISHWTGNPNNIDYYYDESTGNRVTPWPYGKSLYKDSVNGYAMWPTGAIALAAAEVSQIEQNIGLLMASVQAVHMDVSTGRSVDQTKADLDRAEAYYSSIQPSWILDPQWSGPQAQQAVNAIASARRDYQNLVSQGTRAQAAATTFDAATNALQQANAALNAGLPNVPATYHSDPGDLGAPALGINTRLDYVLSQARSLGGLFSDLEGAASSGYVQGAALYSLFTPAGPFILIGAVTYSISMGQAQQLAVSKILDSLISIANDESALRNAGQISEDEHSWLANRLRTIQSYISAKGSQAWADSAPFRKAVTTAGGYYNAAVPEPVKQALDLMWGGSGGPGAGVESGQDVKAKNEAQKNLDKAKNVFEKGLCVFTDPLSAGCPPGRIAVGAVGGAAIGGLAGLILAKSTAGAVIGLFSGAVLGSAGGYLLSDSQLQAITG